MAKKVFQNPGKIIRDDSGKPILDKNGNYVYAPQSGRADITMAPHEYLMALPENAIGDIAFGLAGKIASPLIKKTASKAIPKIASKIEVPKFISEINWGKWNKEIPDNPSLLNEYHAIEKSAKKSGSWMKNPDGSTFKGTPEQFVQQNSQNFKKAFPDLVKHEYNDLGITYHGSPNKFNSFKDSQVLHGQTRGNGIYTSPDKNVAHQYRANPTNNDDGYLYELYQNASNKQNLLEKFNAESDLRFKEFLKIHPKGSKGFEEHFKKFMLEEDAVFNNMPDDLFKLNPKYDFYKASGNEYVVPFTNYPKSAVGNNGMFDMTNPNIYKSIIGGIVANKALNSNDMTNEYKSGGWIQKAVNPKHRGFCSPMTKSTCTPRRKAFAMTMKKHHGFHDDGGYLDLIPNRELNFADGGTMYFLGGNTHDNTNANMIGGAAQLGTGFATGNPAAIAAGGAGFLANNIKNVGTVLKDKDSTLLEKGLSIVSPLAGGIFANSIRDKESNWNQTNDAIKERNKMFNIKAKGGVILPLGVQPNMAMNYDDGGKLLTEFNNGGRHETNIYGGVPQGSDSQGNPNLVEEGETKFDNYIFSDRLKLDESTVSEHNLPKSMIGKTFAEASKRINKLYKERPNDFITKSTAKDYLTRLTAANDKARSIDEENNMMAYGGNMYGGGAPLLIGNKLVDVNKPQNNETLAARIGDLFVNPSSGLLPIQNQTQKLETGKLQSKINSTKDINGKTDLGFFRDSKNLRYAPIAFDALASTGLFGKTPTPSTISPTLIQNQGMLSPQAIDEMQARKAVDEAYQTGVSGLAESAGGSGSALRSGLMGLTSDYASSLGKTFADVNRSNIAQKQAADQFNLQAQGNVAAQNAQLMNQSNIYNNQLMNAKSQADYENRLSYLGKAAEGLGDIGYESRLGEILPRIYGYDQYGNYIAPLNKKACGGRLRLKSYKK